MAEPKTEKILSENGDTKLSLNYEPVRTKLESISVPQYVAASIQILNFLIESGQITHYDGIKQYLAYLIKCMDLVTKYDWQAIFKYGDDFRQLQASYSIPGFQVFFW